MALNVKPSLIHYKMEDSIYSCFCFNVTVPIHFTEPAQEILSLLTLHY